MSVSRHPVALRLEQQVGGATRLLATVMALPLVDGIFPALVIAGALTYPFGIIETGLLIFGGSATVAVILAEMDGSPREQARSILVLGAIIVPVAMLEAALAGTIESLLDMAVFHRFAGLVILTVAAKTASAQVGEYLPNPAVIIGLGLIASVDLTNAQLVVALDPGLIARAGAAAGVGVGFALLVALLGPRLRGAVDLDRFRFGSAVALAMLALSVSGLMPTTAPVALGVLCVTTVFAYDPTAESGEPVDDRAVHAADVAPHEGTPKVPSADSEPVAASGPTEGSVSLDAGHSDRDDRRVEITVGESGEDAPVDADEGYGYPGEEDSRAPWM